MATPTWLVTGGSGMLARDTVDLLLRGGERVLAPSRTDLDIADPAALWAFVDRHRPELVLNCAAYTAVDRAEDDEKAALRVNGTGPRRLAEVCRAYGARLVHISTDYVFAGDARTPYAENAPVGPVCAYGRTKLAGEIAVAEILPERSAIVRTAWLYGAHRYGFVQTMVCRAGTGEPLEAVSDQVGQPTWTEDLAAQIIALGREPLATGIFHATNAGESTWLGLAREIYRLLGADPGLVTPVSGSSLGRRSARPAYSVLGHDRWKEAGMKPMRDWRDAVRDALPVLRAGIDG